MQVLPNFNANKIQDMHSNQRNINKKGTQLTCELVILNENYSKSFQIHLHATFREHIQTGKHWKYKAIVTKRKLMGKLEPTSSLQHYNQKTTERVTESLKVSMILQYQLIGRGIQPFSNVQDQLFMRIAFKVKLSAAAVRHCKRYTASV